MFDCVSPVDHVLWVYAFAYKLVAEIAQFDEVLVAFWVLRLKLVVEVGVTGVVLHVVVVGADGQAVLYGSVEAFGPSGDEMVGVRCLFPANLTLFA